MSEPSISRDEILSLAGREGPRHKCPVCSDTRKPQHRFERTLSLSDKGDRLVANCHHCGAAGWAPLNSYPKAPRMTQEAPLPPPPTHLAPIPIEPSGTLSGACAEWLESRGIKPGTAKAAGVYTAPCRSYLDAIYFPYTHNGNIYAAKVRGFPEKKFSQIGAASTLWGIEDIIPGDDFIIVEGEMDRLACLEASLTSVVSVPNGAPVRVSEGKVDPRDDRKYNYIWQAKDQLDQAKRIIIATDNDPPGRALGEELARRIGKVRCWQIDYADCKDANEYLIKHGAQKLADLFSSPKPWPISGVYDAYHFAPSTRTLYKSGMAKGVSTGFPEVDEIFTIQPGLLTLVTGVPGSGKTTWLNAILMNLARDQGWSAAIHSAETSPDVHIGLLAALYLEKPFFTFGNTPRMTEPELDQAIDFVNDHFTFLHSENNPTYEDVIERLKVAVLRTGIRAAVIDPVGYLNRGGNNNDVEWAGQMLEAFKSFAQSYDVHVFVIAHPTKLPMRDDGSTPVPKGYSVSGSSHYANRPDCGLTIARADDNKSVSQVHCWKARFGWIAQEGMRELYFDPATGRFAPTPFNLPPASDPWNI